MNAACMYITEVAYPENPLINCAHPVIHKQYSASRSHVWYVFSWQEHSILPGKYSHTVCPGMLGILKKRRRKQSKEELQIYIFMYKYYVTCSGITGNKSLGRCFSLLPVHYGMANIALPGYVPRNTMPRSTDGVRSSVTPFLIFKVSLGYWKGLSTASR